MLILKPVVATVALAVSLGAVAPLSVEAFDGPRIPPLVEGAYTFDCSDIRVTVRYRQERHEPESVARLEDGMRVTLLELTVAGASLRPDQFATAEEVLRSFAWVREVSAICAGGAVAIDVRGMPHRLFMEAIRNDTRPLPELQTRTLYLNASGLAETFRPQ
jgi:hypothetical protein